MNLNIIDNKVVLSLSVKDEASSVAVIAKNQAIEAKNDTLVIKGQIEDIKEDIDGIEQDVITASNNAIQTVNDGISTINTTVNNGVSSIEGIKDEAVSSITTLNGQSQTLRNETETLKNQTNTIKGEVETLKGDVEELTEQAVEAKDTSQQILQDIQDLLPNFPKPSIFALNRRSINEGATFHNKLKPVNNRLKEFGDDNLPSLMLDPVSGVQGKLYSVLPEDGSGDFTVSRNGNATYFDKNGILRTALPNEPRFDFDTVTGEFKGILVEPSATNLLFRSENLALSKTTIGWVRNISGNEQVSINTNLSLDESTENLIWSYDFESGLFASKNDQLGVISTLTLNTINPISGNHDLRLIINEVGTVTNRPSLIIQIPQLNPPSVGRYIRVKFNYKVNSGTVNVNYNNFGNNVIVKPQELIGNGEFVSEFLFYNIISNFRLDFDGTNFFDIQIDNIRIYEYQPFFGLQENLRNAFKLSSLVNNAHFRTATFAILNSTNYTVSIYVKRLAGSNTIRIVNVNNQIVEVPITNNWTRIISSVLSNSTSGRLGVVLNLGDEILLSYGQCEVGSVATSYIPTSGSQVTRPTDQITVTVPMGATQCFYILNGVQQSVPVTEGQTFTLPNGRITQLYMI